MNLQNIPLPREEDTDRLARHVASMLKKGDILRLSGDLGAGKTTFVKYLVKHLGSSDDVTSPTFSIMNIYHATRHDSSARALRINHFDLYRLNSPYELENIGFSSFLYSDDISIIEWADLFPESIPDTSPEIRLVYLEGVRTAQLSGFPPFDIP